MWDLHWDDLTSAERAAICEAAGWHICDCCGDPGQTAWDIFNATVGVIKERDRRAAVATLVGEEA